MYKIIVPYDFQELSDEALKQAYQLAAFVSGKILLLVVLDSELQTISSVFSKKIEASMQEEVTGRLQQVIAKAVSESGVEIGYRVETGRIYERILAVAREEKPRFIVMGRTSKRSALLRFGSNTMRVVEKSACPVITIPDLKTTSSFGKIVLPIDLLKQTREEVFNAISFGLFFDATICLVSVVMGGISERKSRIYSKMKKMKAMIEENGVRCTEKLFRKGDQSIHEMIVRYVEEVNADTVMIMTQQEGLGPSGSRYIGAVAHQIIDSSPVPVISLTSTAAIDSLSEKSRFWFNKLFPLKA
ncbi:MAG: universal stress protein [Bacteroidales bacterium]|jgi:nucleotide-binding universal stress UspA family protein|nr:universal stress protein [Bacteroidales bacterium]